MSKHGIVDVVLATRPAEHRRRMWWAIVVALAAHALLLQTILHAGPSIEGWAARVAVRVHDELVRVEVVEIEIPRPAEPSVATDETAAIAEHPRPAAGKTKADPRPSQPSPAEAAAALANNDRSQPLDFTGDVIVTGTGTTYAGGSTSSTGRSRIPVDDRASEKSPAGDSRGRVPLGDKSVPPRPIENDWSCPWPKAADALDIDEQSAVVRVRVDANARVVSVRVEHDPGYGFGAAAADCARSVRFTVGRDAHGKPTSATTPPLRVRFTR